MPLALQGFTLQQCDARLKKWRRYLLDDRNQRGDIDWNECWSNLDRLLEARFRLASGERVEKPWETDDPIPEGA